MIENKKVITQWALGAVEQMIYDVLKNNPQLSLRDLRQIAELSKVTEVEVRVAMQLLKYKNMI